MRQILVERVALDQPEGVDAVEPFAQEGGQAAIELEQLAGDTAPDPYEWAFGDGTALVTDCYLELMNGRPQEEIAAAFHETVAAGAAAACAEEGERRTVVLSGGTFQNLRLTASTRRRLEEAGFRVLTHRLVPPNDAGISYGQAASAAARSNALIA